jgi:hypothetical protein
VEVRHINRSSSATHQPKVDTGAKSELENCPTPGVGLRSCSNPVATGVATRLDAGLLIYQGPTTRGKPIYGASARFLPDIRVGRHRFVTV